ncbi:MAG: Mbeg1-like protein [Coprobacillaceae bacterium]
MTIEEVLLILNSLIYSGSINDNPQLVGMDLYTIINEGINKPGGEFFPEVEWNALLETVKQNEGYFSNIIINDVEHEKGAQKNVCFSNLNTGETYVAFKGTDTLEWHDNAEGGLATVSDTPQQLNALAYIDKISLTYDNIIVSGHSKGGNKAQYVAILSDYVVQAFSFDGQGMGTGFLINYAELIKKNNYKITSICNRGDFVNVLFSNIAGENIFVDNNLELSDVLSSLNLHDFAYQHSPLSMFEIVDGQVQMCNNEGGLIKMK